MRIDHIGYAVKNIEAAIVTMNELGYEFGSIVDDVDRNVKIAFGQNGAYRVELVSALDVSKESPVDAYLSKVRSGPYHICYIADNLESEIEHLQEKGFRLTVVPKSAVAFAGRRVAFLYNLRVGLIELVES